MAVFRVQIGSLVEEELDECIRSNTRRAMQCRSTSHVCGIDIVSEHECHLRCFQGGGILLIVFSLIDSAYSRSHHQGGGAIFRLDVRIGASTAFITSVNPLPSGVLNATSFDVFVTNRGDMLTATGAVTLTPVPGKPPGEFRANVTLTVTGGSGKYAGATGTITFEGQVHNFFGGPGVATSDVIYRGFVCAPNLKADEN